MINIEYIDEDGIPLREGAYVSNLGDIYIIKFKGEVFDAYCDTDETVSIENHKLFAGQLTRVHNTLNAVRLLAGLEGITLKD